MSRVAWIVPVLALSASCRHEERCIAPRAEVGDALLQAKPDVDLAEGRLSHAESDADEAKDALQSWHENVLDVRTALGCTGAALHTCCDEIVGWFRAHPSPVERDDLPVYTRSASDGLVRRSAPASADAARAVAASLAHLDELLLAGSRPAGSVADATKTCHDVTDGLDALFDGGKQAWQDEVANADRNVAAWQRDVDAARRRFDLLQSEGWVLEHPCR
jgi:hypothetical protein